jgi:PAS domain-containing protein
VRIPDDEAQPNAQAVAERRGSVQLGEHGEAVRGVGISQDVTERRRAAAALEQSETRKAAVLDWVVDCIVTTDAAGIVIEFNAADQGCTIPPRPIRLTE